MWQYIPLLVCTATQRVNKALEETLCPASSRRVCSCKALFESATTSLKEWGFKIPLEQDVQSNAMMRGCVLPPPSYRERHKTFWLVILYCRLLPESFFESSSLQAPDGCSILIVPGLHTLSRFSSCSSKHYLVETAGFSHFGPFCSCRVCFRPGRVTQQLPYQSSDTRIGPPYGSSLVFYGGVSSNGRVCPPSPGERLFPG